MSDRHDSRIDELSALAKQRPLAAAELWELSARLRAIGRSAQAELAQRAAQRAEAKDLRADLPEALAKVLAEHERAANGDSTEGGNGELGRAGQVPDWLGVFVALIALAALRAALASDRTTKHLADLPMLSLALSIPIGAAFALVGCRLPRVLSVSSIGSPIAGVAYGLSVLAQKSGRPPAWRTATAAVLVVGTFVVGLPMWSGAAAKPQSRALASGPVAKAPAMTLVQYKEWVWTTLKQYDDALFAVTGELARGATQHSDNGDAWRYDMAGALVRLRRVAVSIEGVGDLPEPAKHPHKLMLDIAGEIRSIVDGTAVYVDYANKGGLAQSAASVKRIEAKQKAVADLLRRL